MKYSLWLHPPASMVEDLKHLIDDLADPATNVPIEPHVTVVGGFECEDPHQLLRDLDQRLQGRFCHGVDCRILPKAVTIRGPDSKIQWNQALVSVLHETPSLIDLVDATRQVLKTPQDTPRFAAPLMKPHMSLFYGSENVPDVECVGPLDSFVGMEVSLWKTDPCSGPEGVRSWVELGRINLQNAAPATALCRVHAIDEMAIQVPMPTAY